MYKIAAVYTLIIVFLISCAEKYESSQYRLNITAQTNETDIDIKSRKFDAVNLIKKSSFTAYPNISIENLISSFDKVEWQDFIAEDDYKRYIDIVALYGTNEYIIQFQIIDQYRWDLYAFEINKTPHTIDIVSSKLYELYNNAIKK